VELGIETIIPARHGRPSSNPPKGKYPRLMREEFDSERYGQRWQVETVFSMIKRNLGSALGGRSYWSQCRELMLLAITHNIMIVMPVELFYRAGQNCSVEKLSIFPIYPCAVVFQLLDNEG